ncbi:MAG TPA: HlyD family efflux transporter periplasmic adaptor subunit [Cyclobacteriaceae bacterium]|nr:HlyD family efflux transporter periplasmic adaptor subunit [Cyclobacteriaceae bacterium]
MDKRVELKSNEVAPGIDNRQPPLSNDVLISDEVNEIISHQPNWIIRHGLSLLAAVVLILMLLSWFIRYPDTIQVSMNIVALNPPIKILSGSEGKLQLLLVKNGEHVEKNQPLAFLQSTGNHHEVISLLSWLKNVEKSVQQDGIKALKRVQPTHSTSLGELQEPYSEFQSIYQETIETLPNGFYTETIDAIIKDMKYIDEQNSIAMKQKQLALEDFKIQENEFKVRERLAKEQAIAPLEFEQDKSKLIAKSTVVQEMETQLLSQKIDTHNKRKEVMSIEKRITEMQSNFLPSLLVFKTRIEDWVNQYVVLSPESGKIQYVTALQENQPLSNGQELFYVEPPNSQFYGEVIANQKGFGKVTVGQDVIVRVESYPSTEFGYLHGRVTAISSLLVNDSYWVNVELQDGLHTNYGKIIPFKNNMKARAEIITQERRLLKKIFSAIVDGMER